MKTFKNIVSKGVSVQVWWDEELSSDDVRDFDHIIVGVRRMIERCVLPRPMPHPEYPTRTDPSFINCNHYVDPSSYGVIVPSVIPCSIVADGEKP